MSFLPSPLPSAERLRALYASTSAQRTSNPTGYEANVVWWSNVLRDGLSSTSATGGGGDGDHLILRVDETLLSRLEWEGRRPKGLGGVIERMSTTSSSAATATPTLLPLPAFFSSAQPIHTPPTLTSRFVARPLWWAFSQLNPFSASGTEGAGVKEETLWKRYGQGREYVHIPLLKRAEAAWQAYIAEHPITSYSESLFSTTQWEETFAATCFTTSPKGEGDKAKLSKRDMEVLLRYLARDIGVVVTNGEVIKILEEGQRASDHPITEADIGVVTIHTTLSKLDAQVESIEGQIAKAQERAKHYLSTNQKNVAMSYLRSKKNLEELLNRRVGSAEQLRTVLRSIDQAKGDVEIMEAYSTSTSTLRSLLAHPTLNIEHIEKTTDALADALADQEEIDEAIRVGGALAVPTPAGGEVDEAELERELEELVQAEAAAAAASAASAAEVAKRKEQAEAVVEAARRKELVESARRKEEAAIKESQVPTKKDDDTPKIPSGPQESSGTVSVPSGKVWEERYRDAAAREGQEKQRAEVERLEREARRLPAE